MASLGRWKIPQTRSGRRSISVTKLLKREAEGLLFKKHAECDGDPKEEAETRAWVAKRDAAIAKRIAKVAFKLEGETDFQGLDVAIENAKGSVRKGTNADGTKWETKFRTPYGYIRGTKGADGEEVDCYVGPASDASTAYVVHQKNDDGSYDEDTVMLGYDSKAEAKADILRHYDDPKYLGSITPVAMEELHKLLSKESSATHDLDYSDNEFDTTGIPAKLKRRRLELPVRDEVDILPKPTTEQRQDSQGTLTVGDLGTPGAFDGLGKTSSMTNKISRAMETLGQMSRSWEVPSDDDDQTGAQQVDRHGPFGVTLSQIGAQAEATKGASAHISFEAFISELGQLNAVTDEQLAKVAEVTREQAQTALGRLDELEHQRPTLGQLGRGALVGSMVGPVASNVNKLISKGEFHSPREMLGQIAGGAIFGTVTPLLKHKVETGTERHILKDYVGSGHEGRLATQIESKLEPQ